MFDEKNAFQKTNFRALILVLVYNMTIFFLHKKHLAIFVPRLVWREKKTKLKSNFKYFALISNVTITVFKQTKKTEKWRASIH